MAQRAQAPASGEAALVGNGSKRSGVRAFNAVPRSVVEGGDSSGKATIFNRPGPRSSWKEPRQPPDRDRRKKTFATSTQRKARPWAGTGCPRGDDRLHVPTQCCPPKQGVFRPHFLRIDGFAIADAGKCAWKTQIICLPSQSNKSSSKSGVPRRGKTNAVLEDPDRQVLETAADRVPGTWWTHHEVVATQGRGLR